MFFTLHANDPVFVFFLLLLLKQPISLLQIMTRCSSGAGPCPGPERAGDRPRWTPGRSSQASSFFSFDFKKKTKKKKRPACSTFCLKYATRPLVRDGAAVSDRAARSKYRPGPRIGARVRGPCVSSDTPSRLGTDPGEPALCKYTLRFRSAARGRSRERDGWKYGKKKKGGGWQREGERERERGVVQKERVGWFFVVGATKGGTEKQRLTFQTRESGWRASSRSPGAGRVD